MCAQCLKDTLLLTKDVTSRNVLESNPRSASHSGLLGIGEYFLPCYPHSAFLPLHSFHTDSSSRPSWSPAGHLLQFVL